jgi:hypothetical protein
MKNIISKMCISVSYVLCLVWCPGQNKWIAPFPFVDLSRITTSDSIVLLFPSSNVETRQHVHSIIKHLTAIYNCEVKIQKRINCQNYRPHEQAELNISNSFWHAYMLQSKLIAGQNNFWLQIQSIMVLPDVGGQNHFCLISAVKSVLN